MAEAWFVVPGDPDTPTGGYEYDRRAIAELRAAGWTIHLLVIPGNFPFPGESDIAYANSEFAKIPAGSIVLADGLLFGALPAGLLKRFALRWVALVHHPLADETGLSKTEADSLRAGERTALAETKAVIATSPFTRDTLVRDYGVAHDRITVAVPGQEPAQRASGSRSGVRTLLSVGAVVPRKGYRLLIESMAHISGQPWKLRIAGSLDRHAGEVAALTADITRFGLADRVELLGALSDAELSETYRGTDLYVSASWHEGYGMALSAAVAHGLPIVACAGGAVSDVLPPGAAILVAVGNVRALSAAIEALLEDQSALSFLAQESWRAAPHLPRWRDTGFAIASVLERVSA